jgi:hypothetical protein
MELRSRATDDEQISRNQKSLGLLRKSGARGPPSLPTSPKPVAAEGMVNFSPFSRWQWDRRVNLEYRNLLPRDLGFMDTEAHHRVQGKCG